MNTQTSFFKRTLKSVLNIFITQTSVTKIDRISKNFVLLEISGDKLKKIQWIPGGKVQIDVGGMTFRTYTPINVDSERGTLTALCYQRNDGAAASWINQLNVGQPCEIFGPRESLDFSNLSGDVVLFGDETSFGISKVLQNKIGKKAHLFLEVNSASASHEALSYIDVKNPQVVSRLPDNSHLQQIARAMTELNVKPSLIILTGRASSIQIIRAHLKANDIGAAKIKARPYWADGKKGLD